MNASSPLTAHHAGTAADGRPPVVLLHGFASSAAADFLDTGWVHAFDGREVVAIDLPGHGDSPDVPTIADGRTDAVVAAIVAAIRATVQTTEASEVDVVAYSLGSRLAWELPAAAPGLVRKLVLGGLSPFEPFTAVDQTALRVASGLADGENDAQASDGPDPLTGMMAAMITSPGQRAASLANLIGGLASQPFDPRRRAPDLPTLLVSGTDDMMSQGIERLVEVLPHGSLARVPGDHRGALDGAEFRTAAVEFLA
jgi:pimeloyl-ACP methyl ester carboxylesterase